MGYGKNSENSETDSRSTSSKGDQHSACDLTLKPANMLGSDDPSDGRGRLEWESCYPGKIRLEIYLEAAYLFLLIAAPLFVIFFSWNGALIKLLALSDQQAPIFKRYAYYTMSGLLGGVIFDFKNLYKFVARGWWHQDRRVWRVVSPFLAMTIGFVVGTMVESSFISATSPVTNPGAITIGFLSGYFADRAIGKMREIAAVVFGKSTASGNDGNK